MSHILSQVGYDCCIASDEPGLLDRMRHRRPDVIVLDAALPAMGGIRALRCLRHFDASVPVLLMTSGRGVGDWIRGVEAGANDFMALPVRSENLVPRVAALLRQADPAVHPFRIEDARQACPAQEHS
ncbi:Response regulator receiver domain-containing protein [Noviherbaspirillum humi]|uniref:Response regulator receiver domain-containing protein n=2 Tax=Noviherbaspirillum humi TaxID=1688639 RepID=A0A239EVM2_9BURK|nr:Response regulator receiver domain-containing protein [Noviherbaspirillum humi]